MGKYFWILIIGLAIWLAENIYFGFNKEPENGVEGFFDALSAIIIFWGIAGDILSGLVINKTTNVTTENVNLSTNKANIK